MILKVSQRFAIANQEKTRLNKLYCKIRFGQVTRGVLELLTRAWTWRKNMRIIPWDDL